MNTEAIGLMIAGIGAVAYGIRSLFWDPDVPGRGPHAAARALAGGVLLAGGIGLAVGSIAFLAAPWVWGALVVAYGSILVELRQILQASRRRRLSEGARLRRHVSQSGSQGQ
jgi:hypothetical protein